MEERAEALARHVGELLPLFVVLVLWRRLAYSIGASLLGGVLARSPRYSNALLCAEAAAKAASSVAVASISVYSQVAGASECQVHTRVLGLTTAMALAFFVATPFLAPGAGTVAVFMTVADRSSLAPAALLLTLALWVRTPRLSLLVCVAIAILSVKHFTRCGHMPSSAAVACIANTAAAAMVATSGISAAKRAVYGKRELRPRAGARGRQGQAPACASWLLQRPRARAAASAAR
jgi:hypothetical protein